MFEDAHWADPTSLELLVTLIDAAVRLPILGLVSHRPEFVPRWLDRPNVTSVSLDRLSRREALTLIEKVAGAGQLTPREEERVVAKADGVPLFIEELVRAILKAKPLSKAGSDRPGLQPTASEVPSTLHDLLAARLDHLGLAKQVLQVAAVIGREFSRALVAGVSQLTDEELDQSSQPRRGKQPGCPGRAWSSRGLQVPPRVDPGGGICLDAEEPASSAARPHCPHRGGRCPRTPRHEAGMARPPLHRGGRSRSGRLPLARGRASRKGRVRNQRGYRASVDLSRDDVTCRRRRGRAPAGAAPHPRRGTCDAW